MRVRLFHTLQTTLKELRCLRNNFSPRMCTCLLNAFRESTNVQSLCEPREYLLRIDDEDRNEYTFEDVQMVMLSLVGRPNRTHLDLADWHNLFIDQTYLQFGMTHVCSRLERLNCAKPRSLNLSNCGWSAKNLAQCMSTVANIGQRTCVPSVTILPVGWSRYGVCYRRPDGVYVRDKPPMCVGAYHPLPLPPLDAPMRSSSTAPLRCVICTKELSVHAPPLGELHTLNLSHNRHLGDNVAPSPSHWVRGERLTNTSRTHWVPGWSSQTVRYKWTCPSSGIPSLRESGAVYLGESPPGSTLIGAIALGDALLHHQTLTELDVSFTDLRDRGCAHLVRGLKGNVSFGNHLERTDGGVL